METGEPSDRSRGETWARHALAAALTLATAWALLGDALADLLDAG